MHRFWFEKQYKILHYNAVLIKTFAMNTVFNYFSTFFFQLDHQTSKKGKVDFKRNKLCSFPFIAIHCCSISVLKNCYFVSLNRWLFYS